MIDMEIYLRRNAHIDRLNRLFALYGYGIHSADGYDQLSKWVIMRRTLDGHLNHETKIQGHWGWHIARWIEALKERV